MICHDLSRFVTICRTNVFNSNGDYWLIMVETWIILGVFGTIWTVLALYVVGCGLEITKKLFSGQPLAGQKSEIRARDLHKYPEQAVEKIQMNLWDSFLKHGLKMSKGWTDEVESKGLSGLIDQFGIDDIIDFAKDHPDEVKEFLSGLKPGEKGQQEGSQAFLE